MSTRGTRGRGRGRGHDSARAGSSSFGHQPNEEVREAPASPMAEREWDFVALVDKVKITEDVTRVECQNREKGRGKRDAEPSNSFQRFKKKPRANGPIRVRTPRPEWMQATGLGNVKWGGQQPPRGCGQARGGNGVGCGRGAPGRGVGHAKARQPALVYVVRCREDRDALDIITGTFSIHNVSYTALIDVGSTHSYIRCSVSEILGIMAENTMSEITILSLLGQSVRVNKLFREVPLEIQGVVFTVDHIELPFREFDLILSMDWLVKHRVSLDCATKWVVLRIEADEEVVVIGERQNYLSNVISALRAKKLVRKGCEAFLAYFSVSDVRDSSVRNIRTIKDFLDVFLEELSGLPPEHEVEFGIELLPGTVPVFIAPYRMAPKELVELKAKI
ncbi:uncharacterized protein LOC128280423 [Gossypium arboreum]|uniref:uncharacterized protein LOC128280423 n=1 Tax=Gossypium arboreum TaxID=29729 RepID=UPI0022F1A5F0|nr:uncharacterized protein LOC128280423 [Gossypium arboreum]